MARHEKTQPGNPHQLTIRQHVFPRASIDRFCDPSGRVKVQFVGSGKVVQVRPDAEVFCAMRTWDQRHERLVGKKVEDAFQAVADEIVAGHRKTLDASQHEVVMYFWALWRLRSEIREHPMPDVEAKGVSPSELTWDQREVLESNHVAFVNPNGMFSGRTMAGLKIQFGMDRYASANPGARWGILRADRGEFLMPDQFGELGFVPLTPKCVIAMNQRDGTRGFDWVREYNRVVRRVAQRYVVARNLTVCPA